MTKNIDDIFFPYIASFFPHVFFFFQEEGTLQTGNEIRKMHDELHFPDFFVINPFDFTFSVSEYEKKALDFSLLPFASNIMSSVCGTIPSAYNTKSSDFVLKTDDFTSMLRSMNVYKNP